MTIQLTQDERAYLAEILVWDEKRRSAESMAAHVSLVLGGVAIALAAVLTLFDLRDVVILSALVPGVLAGLFLVAMYRVGRARVNDRHQIALLARKLEQAS